MTRREFLATGTAAMAAVGMGAVPAAQQKIWGMLLHFGTNMWSDIPVSSWGNCKTPEELSTVCAADHLRMDEKVWRNITGRMAEAKMNMVLIDVGEGIQLKSHPELAVKGSWSIERFREELARLRGMGLEVIPKLNFSTAHDIWLKDYSRQISTPLYYRVCTDVIKEVYEIFDKPRFFHLGYDEETAGHQSKYAYCVIRQGDLWWRDFLFFVQKVEDLGARAWIWSDYYWHHPELFLQRMPKSVLQSNWYYGASFDASKVNYVKAYQALDKAGYDQVPCGSNWSCDTNFGGTVEFCTKNLSPNLLKGFLMAPWFFTSSASEQKLLQAVDQVAAAMKA